MAPLSLRSALSLLALGNAAGVSAVGWFNWQFDVKCDATAFFAPTDEADLASFVKSQNGNSMLKVVGNGHGMGNLTTCVNAADTDRDSYVIKLTSLHNFTIGENNTVTFGGGWDTVDLIPELIKNGLQLQNTPAERVQNYIGAATPGSHGTGKNLGMLAAYIIGFRVVDGNGDIHAYTQAENPDYIKALKISLGALGIITEVTIQAEPLTYLKRTIEIVEAKTNMTEYYQDVKKYYDLHDRLDIGGPSYTYDSTTDTWTAGTTLKLIYWEDTDVTGINNCTDYCSNGCGDCYHNFTCIDYANYAIATPPEGVCSRAFLSQYEHYVPIEYMVDAAIDHWELQQEQLKRQSGFPNSMVAYEMRFVKGDDAFLSPANTELLPEGFSGSFATLEASWIPSYNDWSTQYLYQEFVSEYMPAFGEKYNLRPHWNKGGWFNSTYAPTIYPQVQKWLDIQEELDPNCQFVNEFVIDHLGIDRCRSAIGL